MDTKKTEQKLHSGKWTPEEEAYVEGLMEEFRAGTLDLQEGTTLRSFLAQKLNCKPKRISKKYEGKNYDGKQLYWNSEEDIPPQELRARRAKLQRLEFKFKECLKAIEIAKASRQNPAADSTEGEASFAMRQDVAHLPQKPQSPQSLGFTGESFLSRNAGPGSPAPSLPPPALPPASMPGLFQRSAASTSADTALLLARHHRQQALELELAASASASSQAPLLGSMQGLGQPPRMGPGHLGSLLSTPISFQHSAARQEALMGLSTLNRPASPSAYGLNFARPPSPRTASRSHHQQHSSLLAEAAALEQARMAMANRRSSAAAFSSMRPSLNTMLSAPHHHHHHAGMNVARRSSGNQLAAGVFDESLLRLQQPSIRDLGASSDLLRQQLAAQQQQQQQQADSDERKRQAIEDELSQRKRQRFM